MPLWPLQKHYFSSPNWENKYFVVRFGHLLSSTPICSYAYEQPLKLIFIFFFSFQVRYINTKFIQSSRQSISKLSCYLFAFEVGILNFLLPTENIVTHMWCKLNCIAFISMKNYLLHKLLIPIKSFFVNWQRYRKLTQKKNSTLL